MIKINDYATKNYLNEWEIKDLPEGEVYRLDLYNNDWSILFYLYRLKHICIPYISSNNDVNCSIINAICTHFGRCYFIQEIRPQIYILDSDIKYQDAYNITPNWSKYIPKDHAVLFLDKETANKYDLRKHTGGTIIGFENIEIMLSVSLSINKISIIIPSIHSKNIQELNSVAKDLKEKYGVEWVEVIATHCFIQQYDEWGKNTFSSYGIYLDYGNESTHINKITTTDSTGITAVQKSDSLEVVDCEEFFVI